MADGSKERKQRTSVYYTHVMTEFLSKRGLDGIRAMNEKEPLTKNTVKTAIKHLEDDGHDAAPLREWYKDTFGAQNGPLRAGEKRPRTVQQNKKGVPFIYVRFDPQRFKKGDTVYEEETLDGKRIIG